MKPFDHWPLASTLGLNLQRRGWQLALAESCTGGGIAKAITDVAGSSAWFDRGFVTYSNAAKIDMLGVEASILAEFGAVSQPCALAMVAGALARSQATLALAVTGIAGPGGGSEDKPVGTVFIAWQLRDSPAACIKQQFTGERIAVREQVIEYCLRQANALATGITD